MLYDRPNYIIANPKGVYTGASCRDFWLIWHGLQLFNL